MDRLDKLHITLNTRVEIIRIEAGGVRIRSANATERLITSNHVVVAGNPIADTTLADQLSELEFNVKAIGDCTGLGLIAGATRDALEAVTSLFCERENQLAATEAALPEH